MKNLIDEIDAEYQTFRHTALNQFMKDKKAGAKARASSLKLREMLKNFRQMSVDFDKQ